MFNAWITRGNYFIYIKITTPEYNDKTLVYLIKSFSTMF